MRTVNGDGIVRIEHYARHIGERAVERILAKAKRVRDLHVVNVNSTFYGGGVAELLSSMTLLMNTAGVRTGWRTIQGSPDFFSITKKMHNALQGGDINLTDQKKDIYEGVVAENALRNHLQSHDMVIIHDPQPLPMVLRYRKRGPWIWRCHVDLSSPHPELWNYLKGFVEEYDAMIVSNPAYLRDVSVPQLVFMPAIDPFTIKNKEMTEAEVDERLEHYGIPTDRPIVAQISRFDKWKDPEGVIRAFRLARKKIDATLVLLGNVATDDPEGEEVYKSILACREERILIMSVQDSALVNALQRKAAVVVQKSLREGFGLTVTEAMWKGTAVVAGNVGGIPSQITDGVNGFLVNSEEETAERLVSLLKDADLRRRLGQAARETVREKFLLTRYLEQYLELFNSFKARFRLVGMRPARSLGG